MDRIARLIVDHSKRVLALTGVVTLVAVGMLFRMRFNANIAEFLSEGNERGRAWVALEEKYETSDPINVLVSLVDGSTFRDKDGLVALAGIRDGLAAVEGVDQVGSLIPQINPLTGNPLDAQVIASVPDSLIGTLLDQSPIAGLLLSEDGTHTLMTVVPGGDPLDVARALQEVEVAEGLEVVFSGNPVIFASILDMLGWFLLAIPPTVIILLLLVFYSNIGDRRLSMLSIIPALLGSLWTFGLVFGLGLEVDIVTVLVPIFVMVMGSADGLHFVSHYQDETLRTPGRVDRVSSTLRKVGVPMILTSISTAAGFLSLLVTDIRPIRQLGIFTAVGIGFAGLISFFALPALLSRLEVEPKQHSALLGPRLTARLKVVARRRWVAPVLVVGLVTFSAVFIPQLEVDADQLYMFKDDHEVRLAFARTAEVFGGATPLIGEFAYDPSTGPAGLAPLREVSREFEELPGVRTVFSIADVADGLPDQQLQGLLSGDTALPLGRMASADGLRFIVFPGQFESEDLQGWLAFADQRNEIRLVTGMPVLWDEMSRLVLRAQIGSLVAAYLLVTVMLLAAYRRLRQTLVSLVPLLLTTGTLLGFLAASGIQLNLSTAVASSIVIGVGIDYTIHFIAAIDHARPEGEGFVLRAIDSAGRPIVANALGIAVGLTALWLSPLKIHPQISMIMWVSMTAAALTALLVIPALLPRAGLVPAAGDRQPT